MFKVHPLQSHAEFTAGIHLLIVCLVCLKEDSNILYSLQKFTVDSHDVAHVTAPLPRSYLSFKLPARCHFNKFPADKKENLQLCVIHSVFFPGKLFNPSTVASETCVFL